MYKDTLKRSIGRELSYNREEVFSFIEENLAKKEELPFILPILSDILDRSLSFYFFPEVRMSYGLTWEKIDEIKKRALVTVEKRFKELYEIAATFKEEEVRREALYILIKFLPETELSFKYHIKLAGLLIENLLRKRDEKLSLKGALRHDLREVVEEAYGKVDLRVRVEVYPKLIEKLKERLEREKEAEAYVLISSESFDNLSEIDRFLVYGHRKELTGLIKEILAEELERNIISDVVLTYFKNVTSRKKERIQSLSSFDLKASSRRSIKSDNVFLHTGVKNELTFSKEFFKSATIFSLSGEERSSETKK